MGATRNTPTYSLDKIQQEALEGNLYITKTATLDASYIDMSNEDIVDVVTHLSDKDFYKSMESEKNSLLWQDVYHYKFDDFTLYIKLQIKGKAVVISFKEK
jgi:motility quorum-sensing regulator/GCU-specific mRNA interferase toxin